jgi:Holliday junction resolvase-like predicted endonuclease
MFDEASDAANEMQVRYDEETNHSINRKKQSKWNKKIKNLLSKTSGYKKQSFKVSIVYVTS